MLVFQDAPWRDGDDVLVDAPRHPGDPVEITTGDERGTWRVGDVWEEPENEPDTLVLWKPSQLD